MKPSITRLKRQAKKIKKEMNVHHHEALDLAAKTAGFSNWKHALNSWEGATPVPTIVQRKSHPVSATIPFTISPFGRKSVRPSTKMPLQAHQKIADLLDHILAVTDRRKSVSSPIGFVRCELDEWVQREYPTEAEMPQNIFHNLYYAHRNPPQDRKTISHEEADALKLQLESVKGILGQYYAACAPLTDLHRKLDQAITALGKWADGPLKTPPKSSRSLTQRQLPRGTAIRIKLFRCDAVVIEHDLRTDTVRYFSDSSSDGVVARHEVSVPRSRLTTKLMPMRVRLPYGKWTCPDGSEVLFNRDYEPMWAKSKMGVVTALKPNTWVENEKTTHYYESSNPPWINKKVLADCTAVLEAWGVADLVPGTMRGYFDLLKTGRKPERKIEYQFPTS
ncbi:MAG TPA: DUF5623 domain-containing protein [Bdellovibrionota bacterium]|nr:DUF5623 domain-containing protein [Bdellovibrionota bacterium]